MKNRSFANVNLPEKDDWKTPEYFYSELNKEFNFNFDPCPYKHDKSKWNGLDIEWKERNFINPPYSRKDKELFIRKAFDKSKKGKLCVMLLPVSISTIIFHDIIYPNAELRLIRGRLKFIGLNTKGEKVSTKTGMHNSMIVIFRPTTQSEDSGKFKGESE